MTKSDKSDTTERVVFEVRRTTYIPSINSNKFVFEKHDDDWHIHFAEATHYSLEQLREIVDVMEKAPLEGTNLNTKEGSK